MTRTRTVPDIDTKRETVENYEAAGYSVVSRQPTMTTVRHRDHGGLLAHVVLFVVLGLWTLGFANACYAAYRRHVSTDRVEVVVERNHNNTGEKPPFDPEEARGVINTPEGYRAKMHEGGKGARRDG